MQMISLMERLASMKPVRKLVYYYCQNNNDNTRPLELLLIQKRPVEDSQHILEKKIHGTLELRFILLKLIKPLNFKLFASNSLSSSKAWL